MAAFSGESEARNKYTYFASVAKKEGYEQLAEIFQKTADNEKEHAKMWFKLLGGISNTAENLKNAAAGENYEWTDMYKTFAEDADMLIKNGRYGVYIAYKGKNYRIPKGRKVEELTYADCLKIVESSKK